MSSEEKTVWIRGVVAVVAYAVYLIIIIPLLGATPLSDVPYVAPFLWSIVGAIVASIVLHIFFVKTEKKDQRDREIYRFGETVGQAFVVIGGVSAMLLALFEFEYFWIANVIYLCFVLSAILSAIAKLVAYRSGMPRW
jgi:membrane protein CcdC involved in cytochrome C biogenesis